MTKIRSPGAVGEKEDRALKKHLGVLLTTVGTALASLALVVPSAQATPPAPPFEDFAGCPRESEFDQVGLCMKTVFTGGHLRLGKKNIPITNPIVLRGGLTQIDFAYVGNSEAGILPVKQTVDGGLIGLTGIGWLDQVLSTKGQLKVYATVELAGNPGSLLELPFTVPVKVHLENPVLGKACYVGSNANPIQLVLTTGTTNPPAPNQPISGVEGGEFESEPGRPQVLTSAGGTFVDNAFAVPAASGCQLNLGPLHVNIDSLVNGAAGLPAAAGTSEAVLPFDLSVVEPGVVYP